MKKFIHPDRLSITLFVLFLVFLLTPIVVPTFLGLASWLNQESQKYPDILNEIGVIFEVWNIISAESITGLWFISHQAGLSVGEPGWFGGILTVTILGAVVIFIGPFLYYFFSCYLSSLVKSEEKRKVIIKIAVVFTIALPVIFFLYTYVIAAQINKLGITENCVIQCVFPNEQKLQPAIDTCRTQCNSQTWPSDGQRTSCWNHCGDHLESARAQCQDVCQK